MIYLTQGHENSISIEILLKAFDLLSSTEQSNFVFFVNENSLIKNLDDLQISYSFDNNYLIYGNSKLECSFTQSQSTHTQSSLDAALKNISDKDIVLTLPTSKDQLFVNDKNTAGYTEFLRRKYGNESLSMTFSALDHHVLLITDHIPLSKVPTVITKDLIISKVENCIKGFKKYFRPLERILFASINPHVGENGILGHEDKVIINAMSDLVVKYPSIDFFEGFFCMKYHHKNSIVYCYILH